MIRVDIRSLIMQELKRLMETRIIENVSVRDICDACQISRQTFYRYFVDKYDILAAIFTEAVEKPIKETERTDSWLPILAKTLQLMYEDRLFWQNAIKYRGQNSIRDQMYYTIMNETILLVNERLKAEKKDISEDMEFAVKYHAHAAAGCIVDWTQTGMKKDPVYVADMIIKCLPEKLIKYF